MALVTPGFFHHLGLVRVGPVDWTNWATNLGLPIGWSDARSVTR
jgi:hypothetical protein